MYIENHGGYCCGVKHIAAFPTYSTSAALEFTALIERERGPFVFFRGIFEIILTTRKLRWHDFLKTQGFKEVNRFVNPRTGNTCVVYHSQTNPREK